jgi:hypothetical protein
VFQLQGIGWAKSFPANKRETKECSRIRAGPSLNVNVSVQPNGLSRALMDCEFRSILLGHVGFLGVFVEGERITGKGPVDPEYLGHGLLGSVVQGQ